MINFVNYVLFISCNNNKYTIIKKYDFKKKSLNYNKYNNYKIT